MFLRHSAFKPFRLGTVLSSTLLASGLGIGCARTSAPTVDVSSADPSSREVRVDAAAAEAFDTCEGPYRDFWDHSSNVPPVNAPYRFRLSQAFPTGEVVEEDQPWLDHDPFAAAGLSDRRSESRAYLNAVLEYVLEGNVGDVPSEADFSLCDNPVRRWFHVPWMDANPSKGREYVHGLTRELGPESQKLAETQAHGEAAWAVGFYNEVGASAIGKIFPGASIDDVKIPPSHVQFPVGTVVGKALFTPASVAEVPYLVGAPEWRANITPPVCGRDWQGEPKRDPRTGETVRCSRRLTVLRLAQFDIAVVDRRAPYGWVFGTFLYNGLEDETLGWRGLRPVGLMWGNDDRDLTPEGTNPAKHSPTERGLTDASRVRQSAMFTDDFPEWLQKDLGCAGRLNGPIDNPRSSCMSCHATASVSLRVSAGQPNPCRGGGAGERPSIENPPILGSFDRQCGDSSIDGVYFRNIGRGHPIDDPSICDGNSWVSLDYSLQLSDALENFFVSELARRPVPTASAELAPGGAAVDLKVRSDWLKTSR